MEIQSERLQPSYNEKGEAISPRLPANVKNFLIDLDGTVCDDVPNEEGHIITFFTSRTEALRCVTEEWLCRHGFKYHHIIFGKPRGGNYHWIDNHIVKATRFKGKFTDLVVEKHEIEVFKP